MAKTGCVWSCADTLAVPMAAAEGLLYILDQLPKGTSPQYRTPEPYVDGCC